MVGREGCRVGAAEDRLGVLEALPPDIGVWKADDSSAEGVTAMAQPTGSDTSSAHGGLVWRRAAGPPGAVSRSDDQRDRARGARGGHETKTHQAVVNELAPLRFPFHCLDDS